MLSDSRRIYDAERRRRLRRHNEHTATAMPKRAVGAGALFCDRLLFGHAVAARTEAEPLLWGHKEVDGRSNVNNIQ